jgi:hypothetical protein
VEIGFTIEAYSDEEMPENLLATSIVRHLPCDTCGWLELDGEALVTQYADSLGAWELVPEVFGAAATPALLRPLGLQLCNGLMGSDPYLDCIDEDGHVIPHGRLQRVATATGSPGPASSFTSVGTRSGQDRGSAVATFADGSATPAAAVTAMAMAAAIAAPAALNTGILPLSNRPGGREEVPSEDGLSAKLSGLRLVNGVTGQPDQGGRHQDAKDHPHHHDLLQRHNAVGHRPPPLLPVAGNEATARGGPRRPPSPGGSSTTSQRRAFQPLRRPRHVFHTSQRTSASPVATPSDPAAARTTSADGPGPGSPASPSQSHGGSWRRTSPMVPPLSPRVKMEPTMHLSPSMVEQLRRSQPSSPLKCDNVGNGQAVAANDGEEEEEDDDDYFDALEDAAEDAAAEGTPSTGRSSSTGGGQA